MARLRDVLGINARSSDYLRLNFKRARMRADDKLATKRMLKKAGIPHPKLFRVFKNRNGIDSFEWNKLEHGFVVKPAQGLGGHGVLLVRKYLPEKNRWLLNGGRQTSIEEIKIHVADIVEGRYSRNGLPDMAIVEERVKIHPRFKKMAVGGAPDVRVIVYNQVPVMAMLRLPTEESGGRANLHQGAIGLGVDMATGITTFGVYKDTPITRFPESDRKVNGIVIPHWGKILKLSVQSQVVSKLNYLSVDFLLDEENGPLVLELNDQPGLSIQLANRAGLRKRLERVEGLEVDSPDQGMSIGRTLFASKFASRVKRTLEGDVVVRNLETVEVVAEKKKREVVLAKVDTGAYSTSIDRELAKKLGLLKRENVLFEKTVKNAMGQERRKIIRLVFWLGGRKVVSRAGLSDRSQLRRKILIGRRDLKGFLIDPLRYKTDYKLKNQGSET